MSAAAREKVSRFGPAEFVERWGQVIRATVELERSRTRIEEADFELTKLRTRRGALQLKGVLRVEVRGKRDGARLRLDAVHEESGDVVELPLEVEKVEGGFGVESKILLEDALPAEGVWRLRLRLTWNNSAWETEIVQPPDGVEVSLGPGGVVQLVR